MKDMQQARKIIKIALIKIAMPLIYQAKEPGDFEIVYRVEDSLGNGCYRAIWWASIEDWDRFAELEALQNNPTLQDDTGFDTSKRSMSDEEIEPYLFGFRNKVQHTNWFSEEQRELLKRNNFHLVERKATEIRASQKQAFFIPKEDDDV